MLYFLSYIFYAFVGVWWSQVCLNMMPIISGLDFDSMKVEKERFIALISILFHAGLWPVSIVYMIFKAGKEVVFTAMAEFHWEMTFRK